MQDLKDLARARESPSWIIARMKNDIKRLSQTMSPELKSRYGMNLSKWPFMNPDEIVAVIWSRDRGVSIKSRFLVIR